MQKRLTILLAAALVSGLTFAQDKPPATRTDLIPKDLLRVQRVTAPTTDFSKPEQFETFLLAPAPPGSRLTAMCFRISRPT